MACTDIPDKYRIKLEEHPTSESVIPCSKKSLSDFYHCKKVIGSPLYIPSEIWTLSPLQIKRIPIEMLMSADIWAFGVTFFSLINEGEFPYDGQNIPELKRNLVHNRRTQISMNKNAPNALSIVEKCLYSEINRPTAAHLIQMIENTLDLKYPGYLMKS